MILVDTSIWIDHLHHRDPELVALLEAGQALSHEFVVGELACGKLRQRTEVLELLSQLPQASVASADEALIFIERNRLMGLGLGYVDVHVLAAVYLTPPARLWTRDKRLGEVAQRLDLEFDRA
jgi:predicted nucleic acid-binding protein